jgi:hypothetical protein
MSAFLEMGDVDPKLHEVTMGETMNEYFNCIVGLDHLYEYEHPS